MKTIDELAADLASGATTARALIEESLAAIGDPAGEGSRAFVHVAADRARATADGIDAIRKGGGSLPPFAGIPAAVKDLCDIAGEVTTAGSVVLADRPPAGRSAPVAERLEAAGFVIVGRTNMTEFAYSGLGLNPHHGTPASPWDRATGRIPGGSSSGTAVAVADGMVAVGLGTDTGGSCRIPAAFCGVVGWKPTARRVPLEGIVPLSSSLDSAGPLARTVRCCATVDDLFAGGDGRVALDERAPAGIRLGVVTDYVLDGLDPEVARRFEQALGRLSAAGVAVSEVAFPELNELPTINAQGGLSAAEAWHWHRQLITTRGDGYDPKVRMRIEPGGEVTADYYLDVLDARRRLIAVAARRMAGFDAFVFPTVPILPPAISSFASGDATYYATTNLATLRNTSVGNFLDACAISLPIPGDGARSRDDGGSGGAGADAPVGLQLMAGPLADRQLLSVACTVESLL